jgi:hypothetical protein
VYINADGTKEDFDLNRGATLKESYLRLGKGDQLVICKHGGGHSHPQPGGGTTLHQGGVIHLDGGETFTGFTPDEEKGKGTNVNTKNERPVGVPYVLPPPPSGKGTVKATLYSCSGAKASGKGERSVKDTLEDILGAGTVKAFEGTVIAKLVYRVDALDAANEQEAKKLEELAEKRLSEAAAKAGFNTEQMAVDNTKKWLTNLPFENQYKTANEIVAKDPELKDKVVVVFEYPEPDPPVVIGPGSECPQFVLGGGVRLTYGTPPSVVVLPRGSLGRLGIDMLLLQPDATALPDGPGTLQSPVIEVARARDGNPELHTRLRRAGQIILPYYELDTIPEVYQLKGGRWVHVPTAVDKSRMRVTGTIRSLGTFAAFSVPTPPQTVTISEDDTWAHNEAAGLSNICINVRTTPPQAFATVTLSGPNGYHSSSPPKTPLIRGARQFTSPITTAGQYTKTITVYDADGRESATVTKTFTVAPPPAEGPAATPGCAAPTG